MGGPYYANPKNPRPTRPPYPGTMNLYETMVGHHQHAGELEALIELFLKEDVRSYLEIGARFGGSLWAIGSRLPRGSKIVAVDKLGAMAHWPETEQSLRECADRLEAECGHFVYTLWGDSADKNIIDRVAEIAPFDAVLIDADHTLFYVFNDFFNYGRLSQKLVVLHDIGYCHGSDLIDVPLAWRHLKRRFYPKWQEIQLDKTGNNGFGVLWM